MCPLPSCPRIQHFGDTTEYIPTLVTFVPTLVSLLAAHARDSVVVEAGLRLGWNLSATPHNSDLLPVVPSASKHREDIA